MSEETSQPRVRLPLTDYAASIRRTTTCGTRRDPPSSAAADLIFNSVEISTGAQREHRVDVLEKQAVEKGLSVEELEDVRSPSLPLRHPPHGGFGMGLARVLMLMLHLSNLRETTYLFRGPTRLTP
ncbi:amino acid--tRNA ligase-related protein [Leifsonia sp. L25]|uniref:amino acid--tRNA ligase-related protein n=1 Tax=Leifsonia sp. L25 TaxID=3423957 RepID=UPI003D697F55